MEKPIELQTAVSEYSSKLARYLIRPWTILRAYQLADLKPDLLAGLTIAVILVPQAMAYALVAELPPQVGIYTAIIGAIVGALWGSSNQLQTGPTNADSLLVLSVLLTIAAPGTPQYLAAAGILAIMVGILRILMGFFRLGMIVNFISNAIITGFTAGVGLLITANQLRNLLRLDIPSNLHMLEMLRDITLHQPEAHLPSLIVGALTFLFVLVMQRLRPRFPAPLVALLLSALFAWLLQLDTLGVRVIGSLPQSLPPFNPPPLFDLQMLNSLLTGALAIAAIGLVEAMSIARSIAKKTEQNLDINQEFFGQGLANIICGLFSGYPCSGSFTRSAINYQSGGKTALASVFSGIFVLIIMLIFAPLAAFIPLPALAGVIILVALRLVHLSDMKEIWRSEHKDRNVMLMTLAATFVMPLQYAVLVGIAGSILNYLLKTSTPRVQEVLPTSDFKYFAHQPQKQECPQLAVTEIQGDLYFGAVDHVGQMIHDHRIKYPDQRYLLLRMHSVDHCDTSAIHMLEGVVRAYRQHGGDVFLVKLREPVRDVMRSTGFFDLLGEDHILSADEAIHYIFYQKMDRRVCTTTCQTRAFKECQALDERL